MALTTVQGQMLTAPLTLTGNLTFSDGSVQTAAASPYVLKNRIINGAMQIWQRGTSFTSASGYTADRWTTVGNSATNLSQSTSVPTVTTGNAFQYSAKVGRTASSTSTLTQLIAQCIESNNCYDLSGQTVTLSFWAKAGANYSSTSNILSLALYTGTAADQGILNYVSWTGAASVSTNINLTTTWTKYTYTTTLGSGILEAGLFFYYSPTGTAGADDNFYITGVQLEIGTSATPFERRLYNQELANCQRYYQIVGVGGCGRAFNTTNFEVALALRVEMRAAPSGTVINDTGNIAYPGVAAYTTTSLGSLVASTTGVALNLVSSGLTSGATMITYARVAGLSAEL